jgi:hypothetical protein
MTYDLHALIRENKIDDIKEAIANGADIDVQDEEGNTPLILALDEQEVNNETIECLLDYNPDVTMADKDGTTPLHLAALSNRIKFIKALIEEGANINARDKIRQATPLLTVLDRRGHWHDIEVIKCLLENGADINARDRYGWTALHHAVRAFYCEENVLIALLLRYNPNVTISDTWGRTAVCYMYDRNDLSDSIKGKILSLCLLGDPRMQCLKSKKFQSGFCTTTKFPTELYLDIVDYATPYILEDIASEIPLQDKLDWLKAYKEETRRKRQEQASESEEQGLPETRYRPS